MKYFWTALAAAVLTVSALGVTRTALSWVRTGDQTIQRSCGQSELASFCVESHVVPDIPLLREERRTVEVYSDSNPARYLSVDDPFLSDVTITWSGSAAPPTPKLRC